VRSGFSAAAKEPPLRNQPNGRPWPARIKQPLIEAPQRDRIANAAIPGLTLLLSFDLEELLREQRSFQSGVSP
jgi:hypothetical protein